MACEGSPDCCEETTDHTLMGRGSHRGLMRILMDAATAVQQRLTASQSQITVISFFLFCLCFLNG